jgi:hypothetical protein
MVIQRHIITFVFLLLTLVPWDFMRRALETTTSPGATRPLEGKGCVYRNKQKRMKTKIAHSKRNDSNFSLESSRGEVPYCTYHHPRSSIYIQSSCNAGSIQRREKSWHLRSLSLLKSMYEYELVRTKSMYGTYVLRVEESLFIINVGRPSGWRR